MRHWVRLILHTNAAVGKIRDLGSLFLGNIDILKCGRGKNVCFCFFFTQMLITFFLPVKKFDLLPVK